MSVVVCFTAFFHQCFYGLRYLSISIAVSRTCGVLILVFLRLIRNIFVHAYIATTMSALIFKELV